MPLQLVYNRPQLFTAAAACYMCSEGIEAVQGQGCALRCFMCAAALMLPGYPQRHKWWTWITNMVLNKFSKPSKWESLLYKYAMVYCKRYLLIFLKCCGEKLMNVRYVNDECMCPLHCSTDDLHSISCDCQAAILEFVFFLTFLLPHIFI